MKDIWEKYEKIEIIGAGAFADVYRAKNIKTKEYVAIKEIKKIRINEERIKTEIEIMKKLKSENSVKLIEIFESKESFYLILELCYLNIEEYLKNRNEGLSIEEIKEILLDLNKVFKEMNEKKIIHRDIKASNILISLNKLKINKTIFKISDYGLSNLLEINNSKSNYGTSKIMSPECLKGELITSKSDIWSLGILIYYMLYKKYPYNGTEVQILNQIQSNQILININDKYLNDLLNKMLKYNINERISWEEYFQHPFFNSFICNQHLNNYYSYCSNCKYNICKLCLNQHLSHNIIPFNQIGFNQNEIIQIQNLFNQIENKFNEIKNQFNKFKLINSNISIFNNNIYNFKEYYINNLEIINKQLNDNQFKLNDLDINDNKLIDSNNNESINYIICEYDIKKDKNDKEDYLNESIRILNSKEESNCCGANNEKNYTIYRRAS